MVVRYSRVEPFKIWASCRQMLGIKTIYGHQKAVKSSEYPTQLFIIKVTFGIWSIPQPDGLQTCSVFGSPLYFFNHKTLPLKKPRWLKTILNVESSKENI